MSLRNGEVQSRATIIGQQDSGRQIKRVLPGPIRDWSKSIEGSGPEQGGGGS